MPFETVTISKATGHEPSGKSLGNAMRKLKQMAPGDSVLTTLDEVEESPEVVASPLTQVERKEKETISNLLLTCLEPPLLSRKRPNPLADKVSFIGKVKGMTLPELRRFIPEGIDPLTIDSTKVGLEFKEQLQRKYKDLSP